MSSGEPDGSIAGSIRRARAAGDIHVMLEGKRLDRHSLRVLARVFAARGKARVLVDLLLADDASAIESLDVAAAVFSLAAPLGYEDKVRLALERGMKRAGGPLPWEIGFGRTALAPLSPAIREYLRDLKRAGVPGPDAPLVERAEALAGRFLLPEALTARLHGASCHAALGRKEWERRFRFGLALDNLCNSTSAGKAETLLDEAQLSAALGKLLSGPALLLTFHGGFVRMTKLAYDLVTVSGARLQSKPARREEQVSVADTRAALFGVLRRLQAADPVLVAADAPIGHRRSAITVAGRQLAVADGAAFLAHETGSPVSFLTCIWNGSRFEPRLTEGPRAAAGESFRTYSARFNAFYGGEIEGVLRGEPGDIAIRTLWAGLLSAPG